MIKSSDETKKYLKSNITDTLKRDYIVALKDIEFKKLVNSLKVSENIASKYTSKLETTVCELKNCSNCKSLATCKNRVTGFVYYPTVADEKLEFNYMACKYKKKEIKQNECIKSSFFEMPYEIKMARMKDVDVTDAKRVSIIKWLKIFFDNYKKNHHQKGLFLHGSFGCGKTYLVSALLNELSLNGYKSIIIYYPELLRSLKEAFENNDFSWRIKEIKTADLLLLDDLGAETVTNWNRDEILGTILQYRMDNKLPTFITSNLNIKELEEHFVLNKSSEEQIKSRRIIERIIQLTDDYELVSENRRK